MTYDTDTLRNELLACKQRSIELDQARIDAEMSRRVAVSAERVAVDRLRAVESEAAKHKCPPDVRGRVRELTAEVKELRARRITADQTGRDKPEPVNERLLMRVRQLEAERGRN